MIADDDYADNSNIYMNKKSIDTKKYAVICDQPPVRFML